MQNPSRPAAAVPQGGGGGRGGGGYPAGSSFGQDPVTYLRQLIERPPSRTNLQYLAGTVALGMKESSSNGGPANNNNNRSQVPFLYLTASAKHLSSILPNSPYYDVTTTTAAISSSTSAAAVVGGGGVENEMQTNRQIYEIVEAIGHAVLRCSPRSQIAQSGILPVLAHMCTPPSSPALANNSNNNNTAAAASVFDTTAMPPLTNVHVEFVQACVYAEQYHYAERFIVDTWPRPSSAVTVRHVLRYYYNRGVVHMGCHNYEWAVRCFQTCLIVPAEMVSAIAIAAWKKLVLIQCLILPADQYVTTIQQQQKQQQQQQSSSFSSQQQFGMASEATCSSSGSSSPSAPTLTGPLQLPKSAPSCLSRFLGLAFQPSSRSTATSSGRSSPTGAAANPEDHEAMLIAIDTAQEGGGGGEMGGAGTHRSTGSRRGLGGGNANHNYQALGVKPYADLVTAFIRLDRLGLNALVHDHAGLFTADGNTGLVHQCVSEFRKRQIYYYSRIYSVLSLQDLSNFTHLPVTELQTLLLQLSLEKAWSIQIDADGGLVSFPRLVDVPGIGEEENQARQLVEISRMVRKLDLAVAASPKYMSIVKNVSASNSAADAASKMSGPRGVEDI